MNDIINTGDDRKVDVVELLTKQFPSVFSKENNVLHRQRFALIVKNLKLVCM